MWDKLRRRWPRLYEAMEWVTFWPWEHFSWPWGCT